MSRSGYSDDYDADGTGGLWRGAVTRAIKGKRGQALLREVAAALDAMPSKTLVAESLVTADGQFCTLGALGAVRGLDLKTIHPEDWDQVAKAFNVAPALVREIVYENDEAGDVMRWNQPPETDAERWARMRAWVAKQIVEPSGPAA